MTLSPENFYKSIAESYDEMTGFHQRLESEREMLESWRKRYPFHTVLDVACGTGLHAILLAKMGLSVTAADNSPEMLRQARKNARNLGAKVSWKIAAFHQLHRRVTGPFNAILCLGNSIPHVIQKTHLQIAIRNFYRLLESPGWIVIQLLNFQKILAEKHRIVNIRRDQNVEYIRFYDFLNRTIRFNVLRIKEDHGKLKSVLHSTELYPYTYPELSAVLSRAGFVMVGRFGDMNFQRFSTKNSGNLVIVAKKRS